MATLRELFAGEFGNCLKHDMDITLASASGDVVCQAIGRQYYLFDAYVCFIGYYVEEPFATSENLEILVSSYEDTLQLIGQGGVEVLTNHPIYDPVGSNSKQLPFTGRVILYADAALNDDAKQRLYDVASARELHLQIRDRSYEEFMNATERPLGFISHDSRDKASFVEPLASRLRGALCPVWYDAFSLQPGMSLRESIDAGLRDSRRCVVVLSQNFFTNPGWGKAEFNAIMNRHFTSGGNVLIPIWYGVTADEVAEYSPLVADIVAVNADLGDDEVFGRLHRALVVD